MGLLEAVVVVYLRELYYPAGFAFPLASMSKRIYITELLREVATIVMLVVSLARRRDEVFMSGWHTS